jgi:hypothetical protein
LTRICQSVVNARPNPIWRRQSLKPSVVTAFVSNASH